MRDFPALPWPLNTYMGYCADQLDSLLESYCQKPAKLEFVSLRGFPKNIKTAVDGFHPGPEIYAIWAKILTDKVYTFQQQ